MVWAVNPLTDFTVPNNITPGPVLVNLGFDSIQTQMHINVLNSAFETGFTGGATPAALDQYGYPVRNFIGVINPISIQNAMSTNGPWIFIWSAARSYFTIQLNAAGTVSNPINCTATVGGGGITVVSTGGVGGQVTINFTNATTPNSGFPGINFLGTDQSPAENRWASNTSVAGPGIALIRQSDESAYQLGQYWTQEFINAYKNLRPHCLRLMGLNLLREANTDSNEALWSYRRTVNSLNWYTTVFPPTLWAGGPGASGTITISNGALTCSAATDTTASGWAVGEQIGGIMGNLTITNIVSNGGLCQVTVSQTITTAVFVGASILFSGIKGTVELNDTPFITVVSVDSSTSFTVSTTFQHTYISGGFVFVSVSPMQIIAIGSNPSSTPPGNVQFTVAVTGMSSPTNCLSTTSGQPGNIVQVNGTPPVYEALGRWTVQSIDSATKFTINTPRTAANYSGPVFSLGSLVGGSGYTPGTYTNVSATGGSGSGLVLTIVVGGGGSVTSTTITNRGSSYLVGDVISATFGGGSGFSETVTGVNGNGYVGYQTLTVTGKTGGPALILANTGYPVGMVGDQNDEVLLPASYITFTYDDILGTLIHTQGGLQLQPPIEAQCQLVNACNNCRLWYNIPQWATDNYITNALNTIFSNLNGSLELEYYNECWNSVQAGFFWMLNRGVALGITFNHDNGLAQSYQALRVAQIHTNIVPASSYGSNLSKINRVYGIQVSSSFLFYQSFFEGSNTGLGWFPNGGLFVGGANALYNSKINQNFNVFPNRPIDVCDSVAGAPYFGTPFRNIFNGGQPIVDQASVIQSIVNNTITNTPASIAAANATFDDVTRKGSNRDTTFTWDSVNNQFLLTTIPTTPFQTGDNIIFKTTGGSSWTGINNTAVYQVKTLGTGGGGTLTIGLNHDGTVGPAVNPGVAGTGTTTLGCLEENIFFNQTWYYQWEETAINYDNNRPAGTAPLFVVMYEGSGDIVPANQARLDAIGITPTGTSATYLNQAGVNWKSSDLGKATYIYYYNSFFGLNPEISTYGNMRRSRSAAHLNLWGGIGGTGGEFSLCADQNAVDPKPYGWYFGVQAYNSGQRS